MLGRLGGAKSPFPSVPLWREFGIDPFCALANGLKARAYQKCYDLKTTIGQLFRKPLVSKQWTWSNGCSRYIKTHFKKFFQDGAGFDGDWTDLGPRELRVVVQRSITYREERLRLKPSRETAAATEDYLCAGYGRNRLTRMGVGCQNPTDNVGLAAIIRCWAGNIELGPDLVERDQIPYRYNHRCPCCDRPGVETLYHMIFECPAFRTARRAHIEGTIEAVEALLRKLDARPGGRASAQLGVDPKRIRTAWILDGVQSLLGLAYYSPLPPPDFTNRRISGGCTG